MPRAERARVRNQQHDTALLAPKNLGHLSVASRQQHLTPARAAVRLAVGKQSPRDQPLLLHFLMLKRRDEGSLVFPPQSLVASGLLLLPAIVQLLLVIGLQLQQRQPARVPSSKVTYGCRDGDADLHAQLHLTSSYTAQVRRSSQRRYTLTPSTSAAPSTPTSPSMSPAPRVPTLQAEPSACLR